MIKIRKINHIGILVSDLNDTLNFWAGTMGLTCARIEEVPSHKVKVAFLPVGESYIELVMPIDETSEMESIVRERGGGLDHLCLEVDDINAVLTELKKKGVKLIDDMPKILPGRKIAFVHPSSANGVLLEFYELTE